MGFDNLRKRKFEGHFRAKISIIALTLFQLLVALASVLLAKLAANLKVQYPVTMPNAYPVLSMVPAMLFLKLLIGLNFILIRLFAGQVVVEKTTISYMHYF